MARLTYKMRKKLPASDFVFPKTRGYPIENKAHAEAALQAAAGARTGKPLPEGKAAKVRAAVHRKYPGMGKKGKQRGMPLSELAR